MVPDALLRVVLKQKAQQPLERPAIRVGGIAGDRGFELTRAARYAVNRPSIVEIVQQQYNGTIVPHGAHLATNCLFHQDPGPSMVLYTDDDSFHCYGCEAYGDSWNLVDGKDFTGRKVL